MENLEKLQSIAVEHFNSNKQLTRISVVSDGNCFTKEDRARQHAFDIGAEWKTFSREQLVEWLENSSDDKSEAGVGSKSQLALTDEEAITQLKGMDFEDFDFNAAKPVAAALKLELTDGKKVTLKAALLAKLDELNQNNAQ